METLHQPEDIIAKRYRIVALLGQGGMGTTYEAEDLTNYKRVAIKVVSLRNITEWKILELFEREAKVLAKLNHPGIPKYLDYFHWDTPNDRRFYLIQEVVAGETLAHLVKKGWHANENKVKRIAIQVLKILEHLHQLNPPVIHRDIKPQNIVCRPDGRVFIVDFGAVQDVYRNTMSSGSTFVGTLNYMPLEQLRGQASCGSDLYSLGVTLLFLLTHRDPSELPHLGMKIDFREKIQVSSKFAAWLERMLEPAVEDRFQSASEALKALGSGVGLKHKKPALTKLLLTRNDGDLALDIPPIALRRPVKLCKQIIALIVYNFVFFSLKEISFKILLTPGEFGQIGYDLWNFAIHMSMVSAFLLSILLAFDGIFLIVFPWIVAWSQHVEINLNQQTLKYQSKLLWFKLPLNKENFDHIHIYVINDALNSSKTKLLNVDLRYVNINEKTKNLIQRIMAGLKVFDLTPEEEDWIFAELLDFLEAMPSSHPEK